MHYTYYTPQELLAQTHRFTDIASKDLVATGVRFNCVKMFFNPVIKFIKDYFVKLGFLDGKVGLKLAIMTAYSTYLKYYKAYKLRREIER